MATTSGDLFQLSNLATADFNAGIGGQDGSSLSTGDLRRKYNFGNRVSDLSIAQDPFFRFLSKVSKRSTDDPQFKWTEKRDSWHKRYAYVVAFDSGGSAEVHDSELDDSSSGSAVAEGGTVALYMATDFESSGNIQNIYGQSGNKVVVGGTGTRPNFFLPGQLVKVPVKSATTGTTVDGYHVVKVTSVETSDLTSNMGVDNDSAECVKVTGTVVKKDSAGNELASFALNASSANDGFQTSSSNGSNETYDLSVAETLEPIRSYVIGTAHDEGSGYPETWMDQPYATSYGRTQIWKTAMAMTNTARATVLKYDANEWARVWKEKLIEHKWDIENSILFGTQSDTYYTTQGAVDYVLSYGNSFSLNIATKTADDFLDDMSNYLDPRYNNSTATVFFVNTAVYNWMHKLGGYFKNNLEISSNFRADFAMTGKKKVLGVDITTFSTPYGDMNVARNIHLDGTKVKMIGLNMKYCAWRPLVGNGVNRDTSVYVGVQTLENSGIDRRVDLILTEGGMEFSMPECHAIWT
jgi:hypothetical protein